MEFGVEQEESLKQKEMSGCGEQVSEITGGISGVTATA